VARLRSIGRGQVTPAIGQKDARLAANRKHLKGKSAVVRCNYCDAESIAQSLLRGKPHPSPHCTAVSEPPMRQGAASGQWRGPSNVDAGQLRTPLRSRKQSPQEKPRLHEPSRAVGSAPSGLSLPEDYCTRPLLLSKNPGVSSLTADEGRSLRGPVMSKLMTDGSLRAGLVAEAPSSSPHALPLVPSFRMAQGLWLSDSEWSRRLPSTNPLAFYWLCQRTRRRWPERYTLIPHFEIFTDDRLAISTQTARLRNRLDLSIQQPRCRAANRVADE
jgi:hypothetical protein